MVVVRGNDAENMKSQGIVRRPKSRGEACVRELKSIDAGHDLYITCGQCDTIVADCIGTQGGRRMDKSVGHTCG